MLTGATFSNKIRKGLDARQVAFAVRKYRSHRCIGMMAEVLAYVSNAAGAQNNLP